MLFLSRPVLIGDVEDFDSYKSKLEEKIVDLGKVLKGNEGGLAFPRKLLILDLEKLLLKIDHEGNWLVDCLIDIDIPFQTIIDDYVDLIRRHDNRTYVGKMASSVAYLVVRWIQESERLEFSYCKYTVFFRFILYFFTFLLLETINMDNTSAMLFKIQFGPVW